MIIVGIPFDSNLLTKNIRKLLKTQGFEIFRNTYCQDIIIGIQIDNYFGNGNYHFDTIMTKMFIAKTKIEDNFPQNAQHIQVFTDHSEHCSSGKMTNDGDYCGNSLGQENS